jgi:hypothetical protein
MARCAQGEKPGAVPQIGLKFDRAAKVGNCRCRASLHRI